MVGIIRSLIRNIGDDWKDIKRKYNKRGEEYWK